MTRPILAFAFICVVFGTTFGAIAVGLRDGWPPLLSAGLRFTAAGAIVLAIARLRGGWRALARADLRGIVEIGLTVTAGTFGALYSAERILPSGLAALLSATSPIFAVAIAIASRQRRFDLPVACGLALGTLGVALIAGVGAGTQGRGAALASLGIVISEAGFAWGLSRTRAVARTVPMLQLAGGQQLVGGAVLLALSLLFEHRGPARIDATGVAALLYLVLVASAAAHTVAIWLASVTNATFASSWTYLSPFIAIAFGAIVLHEPLGPGAWLGGTVVIAGAYLLNRGARRAPALGAKEAAVAAADAA